MLICLYKQNKVACQTGQLSEFLLIFINANNSERLLYYIIIINNINANCRKHLDPGQQGESQLWLISTF